MSLVFVGGSVVPVVMMLNVLALVVPPGSAAAVMVRLLRPVIVFVTVVVIVPVESLAAVESLAVVVTLAVGLLVLLVVWVRIDPVVVIEASSAAVIARSKISLIQYHTLVTIVRHSKPGSQPKYSARSPNAWLQMQDRAHRLSHQGSKVHLCTIL